MSNANNEQHRSPTRLTPLGRTIVEAGAIATVLAAGTGAAVESGNVVRAIKRTVVANAHGPNPPSIYSPHKTIVIGETYTEPTGERVTPMDLSGVADAAHVPDMRRDQVVKMLENEADQRGIDPGQIQPGSEWDVPLDAQVGEEQRPE